jgi:hypothetical protein
MKKKSQIVNLKKRENWSRAHRAAPSVSLKSNKSPIFSLPWKFLESFSLPFANTHTWSSEMRKEGWEATIVFN